MGVVISDNAILNVLAYADDLVLLASNPDDLQLLLSVVNNWCQNWRVAVNISKTKIVHFRGCRKPRTKTVFKLGSEIIEVTSNYKYLALDICRRIHERATYSG